MIEYKRVKLSELHEDPANARKHPDENLADIRASLKEFGQVEPLVVQKASGKIVGGNGRYKVMKELGWDECDVAFVDMDNMKATALGIALNRAGERAEWDKETLDKLLAEIDDVSEELAASLKELEEEQGIEETAGDADAEPQIDKAAELQKKWGTAQGQLWLIGEHRLLCGDSTKREDVERVMGGEKADMVFTDPPYGVEYVGKTADALTIENDGADGLPALLDGVFATMLGASKDGACWYVAAPAGPLHWEFAKRLMELGVYRQTLVWAKDSMVLGHSDYHYKHEPIFYGWKPGAAHREPPDRTQVSIWEIARPKRSAEHPTMKPVELVEKAVSNSSIQGELLFEPFSGSGTTFVAAQNLKRKCYGIEISPAYCAVILERMHTAFPELEIRQA